MLFPILVFLVYDPVVFVFLSLYISVDSKSWILWIVLPWSWGAWIISVMNFCRSEPGEGLQEHMIPLCWVFQRTSLLFSLMASPVTFPPWLWEDSLICASSAVLVFVDRFDNGHCDQCEVIPHCIDWHWFNNYWCGVSFHVLLLFSTLWVQFTSWNWLLETWPCLEFCSPNLPQDISWGQVSFTCDC